MKNRLFLFVLMILSSSAFADWKQVYKSLPDNTYVDFDTMKVNGSIIEYWMKKNFSKVSDGALSARAQIRLNCKKNSYEIIFYTAYTGRDFTGSAIYNANPNISAPIIDFSPEQAVRDGACK